MAQIRFSMAPMEAALAAELPDGGGWQYEPKWDGFRCLARCDGATVDLISKSGKPLARYFPDLIELLSRVNADQFILDGEIIIPAGDSLSFEALQLRLHPAESRVRKLAAETPAQYMLFDLLEFDGKSFAALPQRDRRSALEKLFVKIGLPGLNLSPATTDGAAARHWLKRSGGALDGVVAKRLDLPYRPGERAMVKVKQLRSADCVVGGFRYGSKSRSVGSLLLGLYNDQGKLDHVGFTSGIAAADRPKMTKMLEALRDGSGFTGKAPGGPSRWRSERSAQWVRLKPELVVEVRYDQVTARRSPSCSAGVPTRTRGNAPSTSSRPRSSRRKWPSCS